MASVNSSNCVLVTGATSGLGRALATDIKALSSHPTVIGTGRRPDRLEELKTAGIEPFQLELDSDRPTLKKSVDEILAKFPELDTIVLNAGIQRTVDFKKGIDLDVFYSEVNVNYLSTVAMTTFFLPHLLKLSASRPCHIIIVTSGLGIISMPHLAGYSATKAALRSFITSLRFQLQDTDIHVTEIIPPLVESELHESHGNSNIYSKRWMPLTEFTKLAMEGLIRGDDHVAIGTAKVQFERFEEPKLAVTTQILGVLKKMASDSD